MFEHVAKHLLLVHLVCRLLLFELLHMGVLHLLLSGNHLVMRCCYASLMFERRYFQGALVGIRSRVLRDRAFNHTVEGDTLTSVRGLAGLSRLGIYLLQIIRIDGGLRFLRLGEMNR